MSTVFCLHRTYGRFDVHRGAARTGAAWKRFHSFVTIVMWGPFFWRWMALRYEDLASCSRRTPGMRLSEPFKNGGVTDVAVFVQPPPPSPCAKGSSSVLPHEP